MGERLHFWFGYVGSAALVAFLATCLDAPRVATYSCDSPTDRSEERCVLVDTVPATAGSDVAGAEGDSVRLSVALSAVN